jgi:ATP-binding cassette subfamily F protein uup
MNVLSLDGISKTLTDAPLFENVTLGIDAGERIGFVGRNGSGKSTFLRILNGELEPDTGTISRNRELSVSTVEQRPSFAPETIIEDFLFQSRGRIVSKDSEERTSIAHRFRSFCKELGIEDTGEPMGKLSGGMARKVSLARCLAYGASFITLDEPTNHLDLDTIEWLESLLRNAAFGFIMVTHDRYFLDSVCTAVMEIDARRIYKYPGSYASYLERQAERVEALERAEHRRSALLRSELEWLKRGPRARTGKDKSRKGRIQELQDSAVRKETSMKGFSSTHRRLGGKILELHGISKSYGGKAVIRPFSYSFRKGERIGIIGPNGSGKTTFLNLLSGALAPDVGTAVKGDSTVFAHFDQTGSFINGKLTVLEYMKEPAERVRGEKGVFLSAEQFLERFLFPRDMQSLALERLSGGEFRRLCLVRLLATAPNFLLLDEPTNDLDLDTTRLLENYLSDFGGCIIVVSHDRALLDRLTDYLFIFDGNGGIRGFTGSYGDYRDMRAEESVRRARAEPAAQRQRSVLREKKMELSFKERQEHERLVNEISKLEEEKRELESAFQSGARNPAEIEKNNRRYRELLSLLEVKMSRWEELAERAGATYSPPCPPEAASLCATSFPPSSTRGSPSS